MEGRAVLVESGALSVLGGLMLRSPRGLADESADDSHSSPTVLAAQLVSILMQDIDAVCSSPYVFSEAMPSPLEGNTLLGLASALALQLTQAGSRAQLEALRALLLLLPLPAHMQLDDLQAKPYCDSYVFRWVIRPHRR